MAKNKKILSQMNVVPFIDITFVLLVIFIISSSTLYTDHDVKIPEVSENKENPRSDIDIVFVTKEMKLRYKGEYINIDELRNKIDLNSLIRIGFDENILYKDVSEFMQELNKKGYKNISLVFSVK